MTERIVVGVDGSDGSVAALRWAIEEALLRRATLDIVNSWQFPYVGEGAGMAVYLVRASELVEAAEAVIEASIHGVGGLPAALSVERRTIRGSGASALLEAAEDADLLVVGSRGRGGFAGLLLGSVSQQCIQHARCPVVVVPSARHIAGSGRTSPQHV